MFRKPLLPGVLWTIIIGILMLTPGNYIPKVSTFLDCIGPDKIVHLFVFGTYTILLAEGFYKLSKSLVLKRNPMLFSLLSGMIFAFLTEIMQAFIISGRNGNVYDFIADVIGCLLGILFWKIIHKNWK